MVFAPRFAALQVRSLRAACLWVLIAFLCMKAAVPMLAAQAAGQRGLSLAEVCTVYGVRTVTDTDRASALGAGGGSTREHGTEHHGQDHCALASLISAAAPAQLPAVLLHAPTQATAPTLPIRIALPADAPLRWLTARLHAPPALG